MKVLAITQRMDRPEASCLAGLVDEGVELEVICAPDAKNVHILTAKGIKVSFLSLDSRFDYAAIKALAWKIRRSKPQIIHSFHNKALSNAIFASYGCDVKRIAYRGTIGNVSYFNPASWLNYLNPALDQIVCVSEAVRRYFLKLGVPEKKLMTIYKGHDVSWYQKPDRNVLEEFGIPKDAFVVGCAANMRPLKGVDVLVRAANLVKAPLHYLLIGEVRDKTIFKLADQSTANIHLAGYRPDATVLLGACNISVMPTLRREGLPKAVIESMAQEVPAIVTDVGGMPELVRNNVDGLIVPPGNPQELAQAIEMLAADPERVRRMGVHARQQIESRFSLRASIKRTVMLYRSLLNKQSSMTSEVRSGRLQEYDA